MFWLYAGKVKKTGSLVSGNWPGKNVFYLSSHIFDCLSEYTPFVFKKDITNTPTQTKKQKKITKKRDIQNKPKKKRRKKCCCEQYL